jgi:HD-GYP domain-containing protein (c-di-GMP phosphodiesterase class II)
MRKQTVLSDKGVVLPLLNEHDQVLGVIFVDNAFCENYNLEKVAKILEIYANQAASALSNAYLHSLINMKNDELNLMYSQLHRSYMDTVEALRQVVDAKDYYTRGHSDRVAYYSILIGVEMGLAESDLETLKISSFFHDIGKIGTAEDILTKSDKLSASEYEEIKKLPLKGAQILSAVSMLKNVVPIVQNHHERIDGKGYPTGLKGDQIPLLSRIIAVADAYDAMTSDRNYRKKLDLEIAKEQLLTGRGTQFDSVVVNKFIGILENHDNRAASISDSHFKVISYLCS